MSVNSFQVGGEHYRSEYQHWDFVIRAKLGYLQGCATKYISRWRKKNGVEDLLKADHYVDKLLYVIGDETPNRISTGQVSDLSRSEIAYETENFALANELTLEETLLIRAISTINVSDTSVAQLQHAKDQLGALIERAKQDS